MSRTSPIKLATPPIRGLPAVRRSSSAPTSKSSRCTRIIASASGYRRKDGDLVTLPDGVPESDIIMIDGDANDPEDLERLGVPTAPPAQPIDQSRDIVAL